MDRTGANPGPSASRVFFVALKQFDRHALGPRKKQMRNPGRMVRGSMVNSTPLALSSAATASTPLTVRPKWSRP
jgi:hypothetical protein